MLSKDKYSGYDDLMDLINASNVPGKIFSGSYGRQKQLRASDADVEIFETSEDLVKKEQVSEDPGKGRRIPEYHKVEESIHFNTYTEAREHKYTEYEMEAIRDVSRRIIVHDYGEEDYYHMSDEERERRDQLATFSIKLGSLKRIYHRVDDYIKAMRIVYDAWSMVADKSLIHTREEFFDLVAAGLIISNRIISPRLRGMDKYNEDMILLYISNPLLDPADLLPEDRSPNNEDYYDDDEDDPVIDVNRLLSATEINSLERYNAGILSENPLIVKNLNSKYLKTYDDTLNGRKKKSKSKKKQSKSDKEIGKTITTILNKIQSNNYQKDWGMGYSFGIVENFFSDTNEPSVYDDTYYDGSWQNDESVSLYEIAVDEEKLSEKVPGEGYLTHGDQVLQNFFRKLETQGVSTVELRRRFGSNQINYIESKKKASRKANKKRESELIDRIHSLSRNPKFKKLVSKAEKSLEEFRKEREE